MRLFGCGGIGFGRTLWCIPIGGFVLCSLSFSVSLILRLVVLGCLLILPELMMNSERLGFPTFCRSWQREASLDAFNREVDGWLPLLPEVHSPRLTGQVLADVVQREGATAGSLDGWGWTELKVLPVSWYDELARILTKVEDLGVWPDGLLDAYIAMIPKTDGDATPLGQRPLSVLLLVWVGLGIGFGLRCLILSSVMGVVVGWWKLGTPRVGKLSLNCLFAGRNNNNSDLCRPPGNKSDNLTKGPGRDFANFSLVSAILRLSSTRELSFELFYGVREIQKIKKHWNHGYEKRGRKKSKLHVVRRRWVNVRTAHLRTKSFRSFFLR